MGSAGTKETICIPFMANSWPCTKQDCLHRTSHRHTYFHVSSPCQVELYLKLCRPSLCQLCALCLAYQNRVWDVKLSNSASRDNLHHMGKISVTHAGYQDLALYMICSCSLENASDLVLSPSSLCKISYIKDDNYYGRRGPSCHLNFVLPKALDRNLEWFYNEIVVPKDSDVVGSFFMACGFQHGYFGIQVNSDTERRILFSVWDASDDSKSCGCPQGRCRVFCVKAGENVVVRQFEGEGTGGQSYRVYSWLTDATYKFLLRGRPLPNGSSEFAAYFQAPEHASWQLHAIFNRPHAADYLSGLHSFLENFDESSGSSFRKVYFRNQWVRAGDGGWWPLTRASLSADDTAKRQERRDYDGGVCGTGWERFYLQNCGFFDRHHHPGMEFERNPGFDIAPEVDLTILDDS